MKTKDKRSTFFAFAVTAMMLAASMVMGCKQPSVTVTAYPVSFSAVGGTVTASVDGKAITNGEFVGAGKTVTFTAHPQSGMQVARWTGIDKSEGKVTITLTVKAGVSVTAECTAIMHTVTFTQPEHGKLSANVDGKDFTGGAVAEGKTVLFKAEPDKGYTVKQWTGAGKEGCTDTTVGLIVEKESIVAVEFIDEESLAEKYTVSFTAPANGTLSVQVDGEAFTGGAVQKGKTVVFTAVPADGYRVKKWTGTDNPASTDKTAVLTVKENAAVSVEFESAVIPVQKFEITLTPPTANGSVSAKVDGTPLTFTKNKVQVEKGKTVVFTAVPTTGYRVKKWTGTDNSASTDKTVVLTVKENAAVSVEFESAVIPVQKFEITLIQPTANGSVSAKVDGKPLTFTENKAQVEKGKTIVFTAVPAAGYRVKQWTGTDNSASTDKTAVLTVKEDAAVSVEFEAIGQLFNVTFDNPRNGTLTVSLDGTAFTGGTVQEGKIIIFTAEPAPTYRVRKWTGWEDAGTQTVRTLTVTKAVHVSVEFINVPEYSITFNQPEHGSLTATLDGVPFDGTQTVAEGKHIVFTAIPDTGFRLLKWENVNTDPEHGYIKVHTVKADKTVSVTFETDDILTIRKYSNGEHYVESCKKAAEGAIEVPEYVERIGYKAFKDCVKVTEVKFLGESKLTAIGSNAFSGCTGLTSITIPAGVTYISGSAFEGCSGLTSMDIPIGVTQIEGNTFRDCTGLTSITIPNGVAKIENSAFSGCMRLTSIDIPASVTQIENSAFSGCSGLTSIDIPAGVTQIEGNTFRDCTGLTSITIPNGIAKIGVQAFQGCTGLTSVIIPVSVTQIEGSAFEDCTGLTSITLPAGLTTIGNWAFSGCTGLKDITIEAVNITEIGSSAFYNIHAGSKFKVKSGSNVKQKLIDYGIAESKIEEV